jgi:hypothetical protein
MKAYAPFTALIAAVSLIALQGIANADDHLFNAQQHGLAPGGKAITQSRAFTTNRAGHSGDLAPGQGSPFRGEERQTPASAVGAAQPHANIKPR